jgi:hypothetical protein
MFGPSLTAAHLKMSEVPAGMGQLIEYKLDSGEASKFPLLKCGANIFVLPGAWCASKQCCCALWCNPSKRTARLLQCWCELNYLPIGCMLAGVPHLMRQKWRGLREVLVAGRPLEPFHNQVCAGAGTCV